jgi:ATP-dependent helicase/DNAse subunit B
MTEKRATLTDRDRYWLRQQESWEKSKLSAKEYARKHELSIHAFYQARKRLRAIGALAARTNWAPLFRSGV